mmetsp:Transcript_46492/g.110783  ORF Transcript_46492/g.110783 Transcript_46492/m.110783 type:complete len:230 (-) Transcript_46492:1574-2263(-)
MMSIEASDRESVLSMLLFSSVPESARMRTESNLSRVVESGMGFLYSSSTKSPFSSRRFWISPLSSIALRIQRSRRTTGEPSTFLMIRFLHATASFCPLSCNKLHRLFAGTVLNSHSSDPLGTYPSSCRIMSAMSRRHPQKSSFSGRSDLMTSGISSRGMAGSHECGFGLYESLSSANTRISSPSLITWSSLGFSTMLPSVCISPTAIASSNRVSNSPKVTPSNSGQFCM